VIVPFIGFWAERFVKVKTKNNSTTKNLLIMLFNCEYVSKSESPAKLRDKFGGKWDYRKCFCWNADVSDNSQQLKVN
jgi:hypothetical protein